MAGGGDCRDRPASTEIVPVELDADVLEIIDAYRQRFGLADRSEAINELLMIGLNSAISEPDRPEH